MTRSRRVGLAAVGGVVFLTSLAVATLLAWLSLLAGANVGETCVPTIRSDDVPPQYRPMFATAAAHEHLGTRGPAILAAIAYVESGFGHNDGPSSAGAVGFMQFMPRTWASYGVDANGDGKADPYDPADAIFAAAKYLHASGAPGDWRRAIFTYNHSASYVETVLARAAHYASGTRDSGSTACAAQVAPVTTPTGIQRVAGGGRLVAIPGSPGMRIDERILPDVVYLVRTYRLRITAAYAPTGHEAAGEHPLGLALDLVPGPGGSWDLIDELTRWAEPQQNYPRPPFRWVGYDGDAGHGRGNHLHLSWDHAPTSPGQPPAAWVVVFT